jgi:hypothetical protein
VEERRTGGRDQREIEGHEQRAGQRWRKNTRSEKGTGRGKGTRHGEGHRPPKTPPVAQKNAEKGPDEIGADERATGGERPTSGERATGGVEVQRDPTYADAPVVATNTVPDPVNRNPASSGVM